MGKRNWSNTIKQFDKITGKRKNIKVSDLYEIASAGDGSAVDAVFCGFKAGYIIGQLEEKGKPDDPRNMEIYTEMFHALDDSGQRAVLEVLRAEYYKAKRIYQHVPQEYAATAMTVFRVSARTIYKRTSHNMTVIKGGKR